GATLIFVLGFMVMVGLMTAGLATQLGSSSKTRVSLDRARNREYAADAAILTDIARVRGNMQTVSALGPPAAGPCPSSSRVQNPGLNGVPVQVDCSYPGPTFTLSSFVQRNVRFTACSPQSNGTQPCPTGPTGSVIIQAVVNFASDNAPGDPTI